MAFRSTRKIVCIGRNYAKHAKELGNAVPTEPFFFLKPTSSITTSGVIRPGKCRDLHHEVELAIVIGKEMSHISPDKVLEGISGYVVALDMTARDLQEAAKAASLPWSIAKGMDTYLPLGELIPSSRIPDPSKVELYCSVNGVERQRGLTSDMIFDVPSLVSKLSEFMTLEVDDIILTGTPEGVSQVVSGDVITAGITGITEMKFSVE